MNHINPPEPDDGEGDTPDLKVSVTMREVFSVHVPFEGASEGQMIAAALMLKGVRFNNAAVFPSFPENLCQPAQWVFTREFPLLHHLTVTQSRSAK